MFMFLPFNISTLTKDVRQSGYYFFLFRIILFGSNHLSGFCPHQLHFLETLHCYHLVALHRCRRAEQTLRRQRAKWEYIKQFRDRQTNKSIREQCNLQSINKWATERDWDSHVDRMAPDKSANICKNNKPFSKRPTGRSKKRWKDNLLTTTRETEWDADNQEQF